MNIIETALPGVLVLEPRVFGDDRGFFFESFQTERYAAAGIGPSFVQDNLSRSAKGTLRGLHFQEPRAQGKLVQVVRGSAYDVAVDIRRGSATFGHWVGFELNDKNHRQLWIPPGFAHGFLALEDDTDFSYKCTDYYDPKAERCIAWNDPDLGITWPLDGEPRLSAKDAVAPLLRDAPLVPELLRSVAT